jgi:hypothetical protein
MNDDDLANSLERSIESRVRNVSRRPHVEDLLARVDRRASRQRRWLVGALVAVLVVGSLGGFLVGRGTNDPENSAVLAPSNGLPRGDTGSSSLEPADAEAARAAVTQAFHDAYDGSAPADVKDAAVQSGDRLDVLRREILDYTLRHGYTVDQLAQTSIQVLDVSFIDQSHAAVHFTITIPGHGDVLTDRVGYSVLDGGRWKVSLRTACDLLSLSGLLQECPPR